MQKKLYLLSRQDRVEYDQYDSAVVCANSEEEARHVKVGDIGRYGSWVLPAYINVIYLGQATPTLEIGVVLSSFNAG